MITVIATIDQVQFRQADNAPNTDPADHCLVQLNYQFTDGTTAGGSTAMALFPITFSQRQANRYIRERIASAAFSSFSITVDPEDIYIPFS